MLLGNLPVADLGHSIEFFSRLGFAFNPQFTDETANCMIAGEGNFFILLTRGNFRSVTPGLGICDTGKSTQVLLCLSAECRAGGMGYSTRWAAVVTGSRTNTVLSTAAHSEIWMGLSERLCG